MNWFAQPEDALFWCARLLACGALLDTAEWYRNRHVLQADGICSWPFTLTNQFYARRRWLRSGFWQWLLGYPGFLWVLAWRGVGALALSVWPRPGPISTAGLLAVFVTSLLLNLRLRPYALEA